MAFWRKISNYCLILCRGISSNNQFRINAIVDMVDQFIIVKVI